MGEKQLVVRCSRTGLGGSWPCRNTAACRLGLVLVFEVKNPNLYLAVGRLAVIATLFGVIGPCAQAQPSRVEIFALGGGGRVSGDEGSLGTGWSVSGAVTIPFSSRWAVDLDVTHMDAERPAGPLTLTGRHTHLSPAVQYRRGSEQTYGFVALGGGLSVVCEGSNFTGAHRCNGDTGFHTAVRGGLVHALSRRWLIRAEVFSLFQYVSPDAGVRAGIGYRFP